MSTLKDVTRGAIDGLIEGASAADIFAGSLKKIGNALLDDVLTSIFKVQNAGSGGGILGGLFSFLGGGGSFPSAPTAGLYSEGGYTGAGGKYQPAGVVHKGEVVWSQRDIDRAGGVAAVEAMRRGAAGYANGGPVGIRAPVMQQIQPRAAGGQAGSNVHVTVGVKVDQSGNLQAYVENVAQRSAGQAVDRFASGSQFPLHVGRAVEKARGQNILKK